MKISNIKTKEDYKHIAKEFQKLVDCDIKKIFKKHNNRLKAEINNVGLCRDGSAINTSTAIGYIIEEFIGRQLPSYYKKPKTTTQVPYDFIYEDNTKIHLLVNIKANKGNNKGIVAKNILKKYYCKDYLPKLYLIYTVNYSIEEKTSTIVMNSCESIYLESFIHKYNKSDNRNWSKEYNKDSGRLQKPPKKEMANYGIETIENWEKYFKEIKKL